MSNFLYFIPNESPAIDQKKIAELGISHAFEIPPTKAAVTSGPDGSSGVLLCASPDRIGFYPDKQTWKRFPRGVAWVGFYTDSPPAPEELQRKTALQGHYVELLDGREWLIPLARQFREEGEAFRYVAALPEFWELNEADEWMSGGVLPKYERLWQLATDWSDAKFHAQVEVEEGEKTVAKFTFVHDLLEAATTVLAYNYRIGRNEISALHLLGTMETFKIMDMLIDFPTHLEWSKKNLIASDTSNTSAG